ncbi:hypothetical protein MMC16_004323 [Acarospora aff. strigata]|nr:hypothetical protein [Acarospora aff. strigata]
MNIKVHRVGHWLPQDRQVTKQWLHDLIKNVENSPDKDLKPELKGFQDLIEADVTLKILVSLMFMEVPVKELYSHNRDPDLEPQVRDYQHMLQLLNHITDSAPKWSQTADQTGLIGFPINAILDAPMNTQSGNAFFLRPDVNEQWANILRKWGEYLSTPESASVLTDAPDGWLSQTALRELAVQGNNGGTKYSFNELYICDTAAEHYGYTSWDDFFIREFRADKRPLTRPEKLRDLFKQSADPQAGSPTGRSPIIPDPGSFIYNACESTPVFLRRHDDVQESAQFWLKGQPYSLADMLAHDPLTPEFVRGTVYQAFLSALSYHRWHSPVSGTIRRAFNVPGTYYSANCFQGFANPESEGGPDEVAPNYSQAYITQVAARAVIFIDADNEDIGLMGFVAVGMCEVSSNEITVVEGQHVEAGEQLGMFHFGGSTHCLLFRKGVDVVFALEPGSGSSYKPWPEHNLPLRSAIAMVKKPSAAGAWSYWSGRYMRFVKGHI